MKKPVYAAVISIGLPSVGACASKAEQHSPAVGPGIIKPHANPVLDSSITDEIEAGVPCPERPPIGYDYSDNTAGVVNNLGPDEAFKLKLPKSIPSWGEISYEKPISGKQIFFGPAEATFKLAGQDPEVSYVPPGWIGYVEFEGPGGLYCRMISSEATDHGRQLARQLWELKRPTDISQSDISWYHAQYPSTFRSSD